MDWSFLIHVLMSLHLQAHGSKELAKPAEFAVTDPLAPRFPPLLPADWSPDQQRVAAEIVAGPRGQLRGPFVPLIYSPELASCIQKLGEYLRFRTILPNALLELAILVTARQFRCSNIWHSHRALAVTAGLEPRIIAAIAEDRRPDGMSVDQALIHDFAVELVAGFAVGDESFERIVGAWDRRTAMDIAGLCGYYALLAMVLNTAQVPLPDGAEPFQA
jgi:4-carboxymuconolactone decarboxylase